MASYAKRRNTTILKAVALSRAITTSPRKSKSPISEKTIITQSRSPEATKHKVSFKSPEPKSMKNSKSPPLKSNSPQKSPTASPGVLRSRFSDSKIVATKSVTVPVAKIPSSPVKNTVVPLKSPTNPSTSRRSTKQTTPPNIYNFPKLSLTDPLPQPIITQNQIKSPDPQGSSLKSTTPDKLEKSDKDGGKERGI